MHVLWCWFAHVMPLIALLIMAADLVNCLLASRFRPRPAVHQAAGRALRAFGHLLCGFPRRIRRWRQVAGYCILTRTAAGVDIAHGTGVGTQRQQRCWDDRAQCDANNCGDHAPGARAGGGCCVCGIGRRVLTAESPRWIVAFSIAAPPAAAAAVQALSYCLVRTMQPMQGRRHLTQPHSLGTVLPRHIAAGSFNAKCKQPKPIAGCGYPHMKKYSS